ncbi:MAG: hypothetical protein ACM3WU_04290 [Bacillota bacterium]
MRLYEAILQVCGEQAITYREATRRINAGRLHVPKDGSLVAVQNVRDAVRSHSELFEVIRSSSPHRVLTRRREG